MELREVIRFGRECGQTLWWLVSPFPSAHICGCFAQALISAAQ